MGDIKSRYTLAEAAEYLKRETETPELSVHDLVTLAAEGKLSVCFPYKGQLGLFKNDHHVGTPTVAEIAQSIFGRPVKSFYFNGILRSLSRPAPDNEITDLRGRTRKSHALHPVRVVPVCVFASDPPVELGVPEGHHWRRVRGSKSSSAGAQFMADIPEAEWMIEAESLQALATPFQSADSTGFPASERIEESATTQAETPVQRQDRRQARLHQLGAKMEQQGESWRIHGNRGALAQLVKEEKAAGRPMHDKTDVRKDLIAATKRQRDGKTHSTMTGEHSPKHLRSPLEDAWGSPRRS